MSVRSYVSITFSSLALFVVSVSYADSGGETIDALQAEHAQLIQQGVDNGTLTQSEIAVLRKQQALINNREKVLRKDGLERDEIYELMDMLDAAEAQIREMLKNAERVAPVIPTRPLAPKPVGGAQGGVSVTERPRHSSAPITPTRPQASKPVEGAQGGASVKERPRHLPVPLLPTRSSNHCAGAVNCRERDNRH